MTKGLRFWSAIWRGHYSYSNKVRLGFLAFYEYFFAFYENLAQYDPMPKHAPFFDHSPAAIIPQGDFVRAGGFHGIRRLITGYGARPDDLLRTIGLDSRAFENSDQYISCSKMVALLEYCAESFNSPFFGLQLAKLQSADALGPLAVMIRACNSIGEALRLASRYLYVHNPAASAQISIVEQKARVSFAFNDPSVRLSRQGGELSIATCFHMLELLAGHDFRPDEVHIVGPRPIDPWQAEQFFLCPVYYAQNANAILFPSDVLRRPLASHNSSLLLIAKNFLQSMTYVDVVDVPSSVERLIVELLPHGHCKLETVAERLGRHPRTLQNILAASGLEFRAMVSEQREQLARAYLTKTSLPIVEIASLLGYADQTTFTRAFVSWVGTSPRHFRVAARHATPHKKPYRA